MNTTSVYQVVQFDSGFKVLYKGTSQASAQRVYDSIVRTAPVSIYQDDELFRVSYGVAEGKFTVSSLS